MEKPKLESIITDDDSTVLDISEQINRPGDIAVQQQRIPAWHPILDPEWMIYSYLILAVILIPLGECVDMAVDAASISRCALLSLCLCFRLCLSWLTYLVLAFLSSLRISFGNTV
jgi:hypothetical protein